MIKPQKSSFWGHTMFAQKQTISPNLVCPHEPQVQNITVVVVVVAIIGNKTLFVFENLLSHANKIWLLPIMRLLV